MVAVVVVVDRCDGDVYCVCSDCDGGTISSGACGGSV